MNTAKRQARLFDETAESPPPLPSTGKTAVAEMIDDAVRSLAHSEFDREGVTPTGPQVRERCEAIQQAPGGVKYALARRKFAGLASLSRDLVGDAVFDASLLRAQKDLNRAKKSYEKGRA